MLRSPYKPFAGYTHKNNVELLRCGSPYFTRLKEMIGQARHTVHLQIYIYDADETGREVAEALIEAAQRGVQVYMVVDGYASKNLPAAFIKHLTNNGIHFRFFEPLLNSEHFYFGRRLHHKVVVTDGRYCLVGGINISNRYNDREDAAAWLDWAIYAEGEAAAELHKVCVDVWLKPGKAGKRKKRKSLYPDVSIPFPNTECLVRIRRNDWVKRKNQISRSYIELLKKSTSHVIIMSSYFLPGRIIRYHFSKAARRGIEISVIVTGHSDVKLAKFAERYMYRWLLKRNVRLYEYTKTVLHGKLATCDNKWATVGSYNVNDISAYASVELNLEVNNALFADKVQKQLETIIANDCVQITRDSYTTKYNFLHRAIQYVSYIMVRILFHLFTFYFKQQ
jgi:cardiolipin synthase A/B